MATQGDERPARRSYRFSLASDLLHTFLAVADGYLCLIADTPIWRRLKARA